MSLQHLEIRGYQSLYHVALDLEPFTVIVGQSSSGKSALTRALRMMTTYQKGAAFISHGERLATIRLVTDRGTVILKRGKTTDDNEYQIIPNGADQQPRLFTKLGGDVPAEVLDFLGAGEKDTLAYAGQFDAPYLLKDTGGEAARTLGALTNVNVIFEGARESNRRKLSTSQTLRTRQGDLTATDSKIPEFRALKTQIAAIGVAEQALMDAQHWEARLARLNQAEQQAVMAAQVLERAEEAAAAPVPDEQPVLDAYARVQRLAAVIDDLRSAVSLFRKATEDAEVGERLIIEAEQEYAQALRDAATCPTCGQKTDHLEEIHA
jgi:DNA repair ATPase RecN